MELTPDLTVDDLEKLPDHGFRYVLHEGNLLILSPATAWHFKAIMRLVTALSRAGRPVSGAVGIKFGHRDSRTADVAVFHHAFDEDVAFPAIGHRHRNRVAVLPGDGPRYEATPRRAGGHPEYWRVERADSRDDATIYQHDLVRTADGGLAYAQTRITTLVELEKNVE